MLAIRGKSHPGLFSLGGDSENAKGFPNRRSPHPAGEGVAEGLHDRQPGLGQPSPAHRNPKSLGD